MDGKQVDYTYLLDKKFKSCGRGPDEYDCYGLYLEINRLLGREIPDLKSIAFNNYEAIHNHIEGNRFLFRRTDNPAAGDLVLFRGVIPFCQHIGTILNRDRFIHITDKTGVHVSRLSHPMWRDIVEGIYEYVG